MNELTSGIVSSAVWDLIKKGTSVTKDFLKNKLSNWILDDKSLDKICKYINNTPDVYLKSEGLLKEYINIDEEIQKELEFAKYIKPTVSQNIGVVNGNVFGNIEGDVINNYNNSQKPKETNNSTFYLTDRFNEYCPIQIVKSYDVTRDICNIENESNGPVIKAKITMPEKVKQLPRCQFAMILLSFTPFINLENYYDENYNLEFSLDTSQSIKLVQFQIKNVQQSQFIDFPLENKHHIIPLAKMSSRDSWKEIKEICFTVFADDRYITDEIGYIKISGLRLTK